MSSLQKMNNNYFELLTKYVNVVESYHKLEKRISDLEKHNKFDLDQKISDLIQLWPRWDETTSILDTFT